MKNSNFIQNEVFKINLEYVRLQNKTKELFFKCLDEDRDIEYFKAKLEELWGKVDHSYYEDKLVEYEQLIHEYYNIKYNEPIVPKYNYMTLIPIGIVLAQELRFKNDKSREYLISVNSYAYKNDKQEYLKLKVDKYTNQIVPYYSKTGEIIRYVQPSTYNSMIHNTNLTRAGWNTTLQDADSINASLFYIPYHNFSCPHCIEHQNKIMTKQQVIDLVGFAEEENGDILHPNCKCSLVIYNNNLAKTDKKVQEVISDISEHPRTGIGHPKALIGGNNIIWSRRISKKDRVVYEIHDDAIIVNILSIEGHYNDK